MLLNLHHIKVQRSIAIAFAQNCPGFDQSKMAPISNKAVNELYRTRKQIGVIYITRYDNINLKAMHVTDLWLDGLLQWNFSARKGTMTRGRQPIRGQRSYHHWHDSRGPTRIHKWLTYFYI